MIVKFVEPSPFHTPVVSKYRHLYLHTADHRRCKRSLKFQWNLNTPVSNEVINTFYPSSFFSLPVDHLMKNPRLLCSFFSCAFSYISLTSCACVYLPSSSSFDSSSSSSSFSFSSSSSSFCQNQMSLKKYCCYCCWTVTNSKRRNWKRTTMVTTMTKNLKTVHACHIKLFLKTIHDVMMDRYIYVNYST